MTLAYAIIELPDWAFDEKEEWFLDRDGELWHRKAGAWKYYDNIKGSIKLKPLSLRMYDAIISDAQD